MTTLVGVITQPTTTTPVVTTQLTIILHPYLVIVIIVKLPTFITLYHAKEWLMLVLLVRYILLQVVFLLRLRLPRPGLLRFSGIC